MVDSGRRFTVVQISDTHLSETHAYFIDNWNVFVDEMASLKPDLIVHTGDVSFNGPERPADLSFARLELDRLQAPLLVLPGNHDIGEAPPFSRLKQPLTPDRIAAWESHFGPRWWTRDMGEWRLIGLDTSLMGSALADEAAQNAHLAASLDSRDGRPVMVFMHMPAFEKDPGDPAFTTSSVPHAARQALLATCKAGGVKVIASGHLHVYRKSRLSGMQLVWGPTTAMVAMAKQWQKWRCWARPGYLVWTFEGRKVEHALIEPRLMIAQDTSRWTEIGGTTTNLPPRALKRG